MPLKHESSFQIINKSLIHQEPAAPPAGAFFFYSCNRKEKITTEGSIAARASLRHSICSRLLDDVNKMMSCQFLLMTKKMSLAQCQLGLIPAPPVCRVSKLYLLRPSAFTFKSTVCLSTTTNLSNPFRYFFFLIPCP